MLCFRQAALCVLAQISFGQIVGNSSFLIDRFTYRILQRILESLWYAHKILLPSVFGGGIEYSLGITHMALESFSLMLLACIQVLPNISATLVKLGENVGFILLVSWRRLIIAKFLIWEYIIRVFIEVHLICCGHVGCWQSLFLAPKSGDLLKLLHELYLSWRQDIRVQ